MLSYLKFFLLTFYFYFSILMSCLFPNHPVIFTSCHLYFPHVNEYLLHLFGNKKQQYFSGPLLPSFIVFANHSNAYKIVCILFPDCRSYFNFLNPLQIFLNSQRIRKDTQICSTQPKQPKFSIHNAKKTTETTQTTYFNQQQEYSY